jgi:hypothetical protein
VGLANQFLTEARQLAIDLLRLIGDADRLE